MRENATPRSYRLALGFLISAYGIGMCYAYENLLSDASKEKFSFKNKTEKSNPKTTNDTSAHICTTEEHRKLMESVAKDITKKDSIGFEEYKKQHVIMTKENYESLEQSLAQKGIRIGVK